MIEDPEVVFDLTEGDEGMDNPPPNDSLKASLRPPVKATFQKRLANK